MIRDTGTERDGPAAGRERGSGWGGREESAGDGGAKSGLGVGFGEGGCRFTPELWFKLHLRSRPKHPDASWGVPAPSRTTSVSTFDFSSRIYRMAFNIMRPQDPDISCLGSMSREPAFFGSCVPSLHTTNSGGSGTWGTGRKILTPQFCDGVWALYCAPTSWFGF